MDSVCAMRVSDCLGRSALGKVGNCIAARSRPGSAGLAVSAFPLPQLPQMSAATAEPRTGPPDTFKHPKSTLEVLTSHRSRRRVQVLQPLQASPYPRLPASFGYKKLVCRPRRSSPPSRNSRKCLPPRPSLAQPPHAQASRSCPT